MFFANTHFLIQQKERERQKQAAKKVIENKNPTQRTVNDSRKSKGDNRGEFDDLISALRTGDVFGDEISKFKGRRRQNMVPKTALKPGISDRERPSPKMDHKF